ncbi:diguanylate cyclase [Thermodesulfobacteriota bacterium B35]
MTKLPWNRTVLCVDDEPDVLAAYREILQKGNGVDSALRHRLSARRRRTGRSGEMPGQDGAGGGDVRGYRVLTAASGEEAVELVRQEMAHGRQVAVGFFDMLMPGGIDGQETIARIRTLDSQILCAVVTAYTDRNTSRIGELFDRQDDWLYFNKPFTMGELSQATLHLVSAWNRRRHEEALISDMEMMQDGLLSILEFVHDMNRISPLLLDLLLRGVLGHFLRLVGSNNGYIQLGGDVDCSLRIGVGMFHDIGEDDDRFALQQDLADQALTRAETIIAGNMAAVPLCIGSFVQGVLFVQQEDALIREPKLLDMFVLHAVNMIENSMIYRELHKKNAELSRIIDELHRTTGQLSRSEQLRQEYEKLTYYDSLTGIPNRRYLEVQCREMIAHCHKQKTTLACLMIDVDHFKSINDRYGHLVGDQVLVQVGSNLNRLTRAHEFIARYGGEEFTVLLEGSTPENALAFGERIRRHMEQQVVEVEGSPVSLTVSIGIAVVHPAQTTSMAEIVGKSDRALYEAKNGGRNRCVLFSG